MLWLIFCRHGVIHTESLEKLLLEDDVTEPVDTTAGIRNPVTKTGDLRVDAGDASRNPHTDGDLHHEHTFFCQTYPCTPKAE